MWHLVATGKSNEGPSFIVIVLLCTSVIVNLCWCLANWDRHHICYLGLAVSLGSAAVVIGLVNSILSEGSIGVLAGRGKSCLYIFIQLGRPITATGIIVSSRDFVIRQPCLPCSITPQAASAGCQHRPAMSFADSPIVPAALFLTLRTSICTCNRRRSVCRAETESGPCLRP